MYNKITLMGRLVAAPELKTTQNGIPYTRFRIAVNRRFHSKDEENKVDFFNATAWRGTAEFICKYFGKGSMIMLDGEMQTQQYEDRNGNPAIWYDVAVDRVCFTGEPKKENSSNGGYNRSGGNGGYGNSGNSAYGSGGNRSYGNRQNSYGNNSYGKGQQYFDEPLPEDYPF